MKPSVACVLIRVLVLVLVLALVLVLVLVLVAQFGAEQILVLVPVPVLVRWYRYGTRTSTGTVVLRRPAAVHRAGPRWCMSPLVLRLLRRCRGSSSNAFNPASVRQQQHQQLVSAARDVWRRDQGQPASTVGSSEPIPSGALDTTRTP
eukprot:COSAG04_NODE_2287_length_4382_cov_10.794537_5_plen_148_part_00